METEFNNQNEFAVLHNDDQETQFKKIYQDFWP